MRTDHRTWIITTDGSRPMHELARDLAAAGLEAGHVLEDIGVITGSATEAAAGRLRGVPGVLDVSPDQPVDVGPPGSNDTW